MSDKSRRIDIRDLLLTALELCERRHTDNCGDDGCDVQRNRDDCCNLCAAALHIRSAMTEIGPDVVYWKDGATHFMMQTPNSTIEVHDGGDRLCVFIVDADTSVLGDK